MVCWVRDVAYYPHWTIPKAFNRTCRRPLNDSPRAPSQRTSHHMTGSITRESLDIQKHPASDSYIRPVRNRITWYRDPDQSKAHLQMQYRSGQSSWLKQFNFRPARWHRMGVAVTISSVEILRWTVLAMSELTSSTSNWISLTQFWCRREGAWRWYPPKLSLSIRNSTSIRSQGAVIRYGILSPSTPLPCWCIHFSKMGRRPTLRVLALA